MHDILLVDLGNSRIKWALSDGDYLFDLASAGHAEQSLSAILARHWTFPAPRAVWIASVANPRAMNELDDWVRANWRLQVNQVSVRRQACGVATDYQAPAQLGIDRWLGVLAARARHERACLIVDAGTAVTIDLLTRNGRHLGGVILPGLGMMRRALLEFTHIPRIDEPWPVSVPGTSTAEAVVGGACLAVAGAVRRGFDLLLRRDGSDPHLIVTGGDAERVLPWLDRPAELRPNLVLEGIAVLTKEASCAG